MNKDYLVVDTREPFEFNESHVSGAVNIPSKEFLSGNIPSAIADVPKDTKIILYCRSGQRANTCSKFLEQYGFTNLVNGISEGRVNQMLQNEKLQ